MRELLLGPKRFRDLVRGLRGMSQNVLSQRLKELEQAGLVRKAKAGPPVSGTVYGLTEAGEALEPVLVALGRWGRDRPQTATGPMSPDALLLALRTTFDPETARDPAIELELRIDDDIVTLRVADGDVDDLLTTGEAAALLRSSRQHVVDMCERGLLPYAKVGTHRRLRRTDVEAVLRPELTRDQLKALWLHRAVAGRLVQQPDAVLNKAVANLERLHRIHSYGATAAWLRRWRVLLDAGVEAVLDALTSRAPYAIELRQNSPFAGVLSEAERRAVLTAFSVSWRREHAA